MLIKGIYGNINGNSDLYRDIEKESEIERLSQRERDNEILIKKEYTII